MIDALLFSMIVGSPVFQSEVKCLASVIYHEARGEPVKGQYQVGRVVLNRVKSKHYPDNICRVAFQKEQFSGLNSIKFSRESLKVASDLLIHNIRTRFPNAMYYHTTKVNPYWNKWNKLNRVGKIGNHIFYRRKDG